MSGHFLKGEGWREAVAAPGATGVILVRVNAGGINYFLSTLDLEMKEDANGRAVRFVGAIVNDPVLEESVDVFSRQSSVYSLTFDVMEEHFPVTELRKSGVLMQDVDVDVYWSVKGLRFDQAVLMVSGKLTEPTYREDRKVASFKVEDGRLENQAPFPPVVATATGLANLVDEYAGHPYPVVVGSASMLPVMDVDSTAPGITYLAMLDQQNEFSGSPVSAIYDGDDAGAPHTFTQSQQTDSLGNRYWQVVVTSGALTSKDVTVDVTGHVDTRPDQVIRYLMQFFGGNRETFDLGSLDEVARFMSDVELGMMFNSRDRGGVLNAVRSRISGVLPLTMIQRGAKYEFAPIVWDRNVVRHLSYDKNISRITSGPTETRRSDVFTDFVIRYGRSGLRGDHLGAIHRNHDNSYECAQARRWYGENAMPEVDAGDVSNRSGAEWLMGQVIETYAKMRVFAEYACDLEVANVRLLDTVKVVDPYQGFDTLFKVVKIRRGTTPEIGLGLVSIDDYVNVYGVNS